MCYLFESSVNILNSVGSLSAVLPPSLMLEHVNGNACWWGGVVMVAWVTLACLFFTSSMGVFSFLGGQDSLEDGLGLTVFVSVYFCIYLFVYV